MLALTEADLKVVEQTRKAIKSGNVEVLNLDIADDAYAKLRDEAADLPITWEELVVVLMVRQLPKKRKKS